MATTYVGYTDTAGMRILTRESNVRYIIRRPTGKYLINVLGNKVWIPSNNNVVYPLIALPIGVAFVDGVTGMIIHTHTFHPVPGRRGQRAAHFRERNRGPRLAVEPNDRAAGAVVRLMLWGGVSLCLSC